MRVILVDTSVWIDHFRAADAQLTQVLTNNEALTHPCVIGELALGSLARRAEVLGYMRNLPQALVATDAEVLVFIESHKLANTGVGYVDACLLAAASLTPGAALWSRDKNVRAAALACGLAPASALR